jgi:CRISPR/Cas system-associated exonuclease Cas4 (RecB family)
MFPQKPIVIDMKTMNSYMWDNKLMKLGNMPEYVIQLTIYVHLLDCEYGAVIYENKNDSSAAAYKVERNQKTFDEICRQAKLMKALAEKKLLPPPRPAEHDAGECKNCEFSSRCEESGIWDDPRLEEKRKKFYNFLL